MAELPISAEMLWYSSRRQNRAPELSAKFREKLEQWVQRELKTATTDEKEVVWLNGGRVLVRPLSWALKLLLEDPNNPRRMALIEQIKQRISQLDPSQTELLKSLNAVLPRDTVGERR